jgi:Beta-lactamase
MELRLIDDWPGRRCGPGGASAWWSGAWPAASNGSPATATPASATRTPRPRDDLRDRVHHQGVHRAALADLAAHGVVGLDDPLARYLPASVTVPAFEGREITLGDLSSHAAGLARNPKGTLRGWLRERRNPFAALSVEDVHQGLARTRLRHRPGEPVRDSLGAGSLGQALERAAGQPTSGWSGSGSAGPWACPTPSSSLRGAGRPGGRQPHLAGPAGAAVRGPGAARRRGAALHGRGHAAVPGGQPRPGRHPPGGPARTHPAAPPPEGRGMRVGLGWLIVRSPGPAGPLLWHNGGPTASAASPPSPATAASPGSCSATPPAWSTGSASGSSGPWRPAPADESHRGNRVSSASGPGSLSRSLRR